MRHKCTHPDHNDKETCQERAVSCNINCPCCVELKDYKIGQVVSLKVKQPIKGKIVGLHGVFCWVASENNAKPVTYHQDEID